MVRAVQAQLGAERVLYRVLPEGVLRNYDGAIIEIRSPKERLDLNRNFPAGWRQERAACSDGSTLPNVAP